MALWEAAQLLSSIKLKIKSGWDLPGLRVEKMPWGLDAARFDIELNFWETL